MSIGGKERSFRAGSARSAAISPHMETLKPVLQRAHPLEPLFTGALHLNSSHFTVQSFMM